MVWVQEKRVDGVLIVKKVKYLKGLFFVARNEYRNRSPRFDRNFLNIYEGTQVEKVRICAKWVFNVTCGLNQAGENLTWSRLLASRDKRKKATEKKS